MTTSAHAPRPESHAADHPFVRVSNSVDEMAAAQADNGPERPVTGDPFGPDIEAKAKELAEQYPDSRSALLPMLHLVQSVQGYVSQEGVAFCGRHLGLSEAEVSGVVTFYTMYKRKPCGEHLVGVCTNALCAALGGDEIYQTLQKHLGSEEHPLEHEETAGTPGEPGSITLEHTECLAACDLAPVLQVNYEYFDNQTPDEAVKLVDALRRGEKPAPTRGAELSDLKTVQRELAGFMPEDEAAFRADVDGPSQAEQTVRGAQMAAENGWTAPAMPDNVSLPDLEAE